MRSLQRFSSVGAASEHGRGEGGARAHRDEVEVAGEWVQAAGARVGGAEDGVAARRRRLVRDEDEEQAEDEEDEDAQRQGGRHGRGRGHVEWARGERAWRERVERVEQEERERVCREGDPRAHVPCGRYPARYPTARYPSPVPHSPCTPARYPTARSPASSL